MAELAVTIFVVILVLGAVKIPALGDAIGRRLRGPTAPRPEAKQQPPLSGPERAGTR
jgi:Sec-independent protein translocase protein TatA